MEDGSGAGGLQRSRAAGRRARGAAPDGTAILGLGGDRRENWGLLAGEGWLPGGVIHPRAHVAATADVAPSATVGPLAVIGARTSVGDHAILSRGALVGHHVRIGEFATLNPGVNLGGNSEVGAGAFLGMGSVIVNGTSVGAGAIAAGAVTIRDVAAEARGPGSSGPSLPGMMSASGRPRGVNRIRAALGRRIRGPYAGIDRIERRLGALGTDLEALRTDLHSIHAALGAIRPTTTRCAPTSAKRCGRSRPTSPATAACWRG